jgi:serine/threonine protein kinase
MAGRKPLSRNFTSKSTAQSKVFPEYILQPSDYTVECETPIGVGGCSTVYMGLYRGSSMAVKCYTIGNAEMNPGKALLLQEAETLLKLQHLNVVKCLGICPQKGSLLLELTKIKITRNNRDLCVNSLRQLFDTVGDVMDQDLKHEALFKVVEGLSYLHNNTIVHFDLKSANVL